MKGGEMGDGEGREERVEVLSIEGNVQRLFFKYRQMR